MLASYYSFFPSFSLRSSICFSLYKGWFFLFGRNQYWLSSFKSFAEQSSNSLRKLFLIQLLFLFYFTSRCNGRTDYSQPRLRRSCNEHSMITPIACIFPPSMVRGNDKCRVVFIARCCLYIMP